MNAWVVNSEAEMRALMERLFRDNPDAVVFIEPIAASSVPERLPDAVDPEEAHVAELFREPEMD